MHGQARGSPLPTHTQLVFHRSAARLASLASLQAAFEQLAQPESAA